MKGFRAIGGRIGLSYLVSILFLFSINCSRLPKEHIKVVATTSLIGTIVEVIGRERVDLVTIVPAGMCPGHFDVKPVDIENLSDADLLLNQGFEGWVKSLINASENKGLRVETIALEEDWMVPEIHKMAAEEITQELCKIDAQNRNFYEGNLSSYIKSVDATSLKIRKTTQNLRGTKVVCAEYQKAFLNWLGFKIITTYGRPEELTPKRMIEIIRMAKSEDVKLVVDNLQSGKDAGRTIAEEVGAAHIVLTDFPLGDSYITSLNENIDKIIEAINE